MAYALPLVNYNLRSLGSMPAGDGKKVKEGMIYRSGCLDNITNKYLPTVESLNLKTIIDLRPQTEQPNTAKSVRGAVKITIPFDIDNLTRERLKPFLPKPDSEKEIIKVIESVYLDMVDILKPSLPKLFAVLSNEESYPLLISCRAGKDRTGFATAILLSALGVPEEMIVADYLKTNDWLYKIRRKKWWLIRLMTFGRYPLKNLESAFLVREHYIKLVLEKIKTDYRGTGNYLKNAGISDNQIQKVRKILVADFV